MSRFLLVCNRTAKRVLKHNHIEQLSMALEPDNVTFNTPKVIVNEDVTYVAFNPVPSLRFSSKGMYFGGLSDPGTEWDEVGSLPQRGDIVIWRNNTKKVEVLADPVAVRTLWYYFDQEQLIISTSQRAIIMMLGSFEVNKKVIPWMLRCGSIGPNAWDKRVKYIPGNSFFILDREKWEINIDREVIEANIIERTEEEQIEMLKETISGAFDNFDYNPEEWQLALSGGYDSRTLLLFLKEKAEPHCITWGLKNAIDIPYNDAFVVKKLAAQLSLNHSYYETDLSNEPAETVFRRFLICGEGRVDHVSGYMDGFGIWKMLFEKGIHGVIRANQGFGQRYVSNEMDVRRCVGIRIDNELIYNKEFSELKLNESDLPEWMARKDGETLEVWRDRLYYNFRIPFVHGGLNELKVAYTEVVNPWYTYSIIKKAHELPDDSRSQKTMFKKVLKSIGPDIEFAKYPAIEFAHDIFRKPKTKEFLTSYLESIYNNELISEELIEHVLCRMDAESKKSQIFSKRTIALFIRQHFPTKLVKTIRKVPVTRTLDDYTLAFRIYLINEMVKILERDKQILS